MLSSPYLRLKITIAVDEKSTNLNDYMQIIHPNRHQLTSLCLSNSTTIDLFLQTMKFDSMFQRLESIVLNGLKVADLLPILLALIPIPQLTRSIFTVSDNTISDFSHVYRVIFGLSALKYNKLSFKGPLPTLLLRNINNQPSPIKRLNLDHACQSDDLAYLLSYTPYLSYLRCARLIQSPQTIEKITISLPYLTHLFIERSYLRFDELEKLITKISSQLRIFNIAASNNAAYLDPDRWERLILLHMPRLHSFHFMNHQSMGDSFDITPYHESIQGFTSRFWIERQWIFQVQINLNYLSRTNIFYSIHPNKRQCNSDVALNNPNYTELWVRESSFAHYCASVIDNLAPLFTLVQIIKIHIMSDTASSRMLLDLLRYLPNLGYLRLKTLSVPKPRFLHAEENQTFHSISTSNKIVQVRIQQLTDFEQVQFLIDLCPMMKFLTINNSHAIASISLVRFVLSNNSKHISHLHYTDKLIMFDHENDLMERLYQDIEHYLRQQAEQLFIRANDFKERAKYFDNGPCG
ncbi:hypothetical protein I4U23_012964 [Adineta vaga]|nr:hypothetical protein I4U23_012964 [Adineta vaga]